jgi:Lon-like ATP-dependent protease
LTITKLEWNELTPDTESYQDVFKQSALTDETVFFLGDTQPRLHYALEQLLHPAATSRFMLAKAPEEEEYLTILAGAVSALQPEEIDVVGGDYQVNGRQLRLPPHKTQKPILPVKTR